MQSFVSLPFQISSKNLYSLFGWYVNHGEKMKRRDQSLGERQGQLAISLSADVAVVDAGQLAILLLRAKSYAALHQPQTWQMSKCKPDASQAQANSGRGRGQNT